MPMISKSTMNQVTLGTVGRELVTLPLYASEQQVAQLVLGENRDLWRDIVGHLEGRGLPRRSQLIGGLRYVPGVVRYFERAELGVPLGDATSFAQDGEEHWER
jgi:hypothetical protein